MGRNNRTPDEIKDLQDKINFHYWDNGKNLSWIAKNLNTSLKTIHALLFSKTEWERLK